MVTSQFQYVAPATVEEAARLLSRHSGEARLLAGGHSLIPLMKTRLSEPSYLIDLGRIPGLSYIRDEGGVLAIGAMTTYYELETSDLVQQKAPVLARVSGHIADMQVRNKGTIGGSLAHSDPAGDLPAVVLALGAEMVASTSRGSRTISADRFMVDFLTTALRPNEILTEIRVPALPPRTGTAYWKLPNKASHYAVVAAAAVVTLDDAGICTAARVAITGAGPHAVRARRTERVLIGKEPSPSVIRRAAERAGAEIGDQFNDDVHASAEYRAEMTKVFARKAIAEAVRQAG